MLDKDDKRLVNRIRKAVKGNKGISLEELAEILDESTDLVLIYIDNYAENVVEYEPNKFKLKQYYWLNKRANFAPVDHKLFLNKELACEYLFNDILIISEETRDTYKQGDIDLQIETAKDYGYELKQDDRIVVNDLYYSDK